MTRVLVVDDEPQIVRALGTMLRTAGYDVTTAATAAEALTQAAATRPDALIVDLALPDGSGSDVVRELRAWSEAAVIVLSAIDEQPEKVAALDAGADDYVTKPFGPEELLARLRAALRRTSDDGAPVLTIGSLEVDFAGRAASVDGRRVRLTPHEWELLRALAANHGRLMTHKALLREVWGPAYGDESHYLHVYVSQLRRKLEADPAHPRYLHTEPGAGYRLVDALSES